MHRVFFILALMGVSHVSLFSQNTFTLSSKTVGGEATKQEEFNGFGCDGKNQSPQLSWINPPKETKSFAVTMYDPDAPTGSGWWHWLVFDIPSEVDHLEVNAGDLKSKLMPKQAIQSITDYGIRGYGGPCPPKGHGSHRYIITVYALKVDSLGLDENTNPPVVGYNIWSNTIAKASIITYYEKK